MTKKDYVAFARIIQQERADVPSYISDTTAQVIAFQAIRRIVGAMMIEFAQDNPRFNRERFLIACGLGVSA